MIWLIILIWFSCGFVASGFFYASFQKEFPLIANREDDTKFSLILVIGGCASLFVALTMASKYGWRFPGS